MLIVMYAFRVLVLIFFIFFGLSTDFDVNNVQHHELVIIFTGYSAI